MSELVKIGEERHAPALRNTKARAGTRASERGQDELAPRRERYAPDPTSSSQVTVPTQPRRGLAYSPTSRSMCLVPRSCSSPRSRGSRPARGATRPNQPVMELRSVQFAKNAQRGYGPARYGTDTGAAFAAISRSRPTIFPTAFFDSESFRDDAAGLLLPSVCGRISIPVADAPTHAAGAAAIVAVSNGRFMVRLHLERGTPA